MAVAAYASVTSLLHVLDQVQHPARRRLLPNPKQIETLHEKVHFLQQFLELHSPTKIEGMEDLMKQITEVTYEAEDIIDSHVVDQLRQEYEVQTDDMVLSSFLSEGSYRVQRFAQPARKKMKINSHVADNQLREEYEDETDDMGLSLLFSEMNIGADHQLHGASQSTIDIDKVIEKIESIKNKVDYYVMTMGAWDGFHVGLLSTDPPGRCRRTDGKKWRCSRDAVVDKKYCKRHLNRGGRNHPPISSSISSSVVVIGGVSNNLVSANDHLSGMPNIINRSLVDKEIPKDKHTYSLLEQTPTVSVASGSLALPSPGKSTRAVGLDELLIQIMDQLTRDQPNLQIIPIVGMGGIGKTTLARLAFENKCVEEHFDVRVWFTISQEYSVHGILLGILRDVGVPGHSKRETLANLGQCLHKHLSGRRYLIVMDDLWSTNDWDDFKLYFPNNMNGSRVMVTTRLSDVANSLCSHNPYFMEFLDEDNSWNLLCDKAFSQGSCSPDLEEIGKRIARSCRGLPLAIIVIGGLLAKSDMTRKYWEFVAENVHSFANSENDEQCLKILALSYHHLPIHLKPCFLYMSVFSKDHEVRVFELTNLWIAEGFLKSSRDKDLEDVAEEYLKDLVERNLILVHKRECTGKIEACGTHDLLRDLCMRESHKEHYLVVPKVQHIEIKLDVENMCILCSGIGVHEVILSSSQSSSRDRPWMCDWMCDSCKIMYPELNRFRFVTVMLDGDGRRIKNIPQPTTLQYLNITSTSYLGFVSRTIPLLWNLQTLIFNGHQEIFLPAEIWEMSQLRHINIKHCYLAVPVDNQIERKYCAIQENLNTLSHIYHFRFTEEVVKRIPNIRKLTVDYNEQRSKDWSYYSLYNIAHLIKLESLSLLRAEIFSLEIIAFPRSLKELELSWCKIPWKHMTIIGNSLPNLEVLKLKRRAFIGPEWNPVEGEFLQLKFLSIGETDLKCWEAENIHFPCLESLTLQRIRSLEEIPSGIGEIATLRLIHLDACSDTVMDSAKQIIEEQRSMGNDDLQLVSV